MAPSAQSGLKKQYLSSGTEPKKAPMEPRPSASILLISSLNQILLLHRVRRSTDTFAAAHVFPGGNLSTTQDGPIPPPTSPARHIDGPAYRLGAIRECFEESGILLAKKANNSNQLLEVSKAETDRARKEIHAGNLRFEDWVREQRGIIDLEGLYPFTRWVTPTNIPKRFTTQMYIYFLPLNNEDLGNDTITGLPVKQETVIPIPTHDGGVEHTAALFQFCREWLDQARRNEIVLFPPQFFLMYLLSSFLQPPSDSLSDSHTSSFTREELQRQRNEVLKFLESDGGDGGGVKWADKVISPMGLGGFSKDGRAVLGLDGPGPELKGSGRKGDSERVVLVKFGKAGPKDLEVRGRREMLDEIREVKERAESEGKGKVTKL